MPESEGGIDGTSRYTQQARPGNTGHADLEDTRTRADAWIRIGVRITQISKGVFQVNAGSLFPAFRRLERDGLIDAEWRATENNRQAKYYALTTRGRATLKSRTKAWESQTGAIARILNASLIEL